ncbi:MAG: hypothetical protein ACKPJJ_28750, partial [Planctomycetaceae bacterium]
ISQGLAEFFFRGGTFFTGSRDAFKSALGASSSRIGFGLLRLNSGKLRFERTLIHLGDDFTGDDLCAGPEGNFSEMAGDACPNLHLFTGFDAAREVLIILNFL